MRKIKENKGITLLALIVTIIVLLILAGISVGVLTGDNGIIKNAGDAKTGSEIFEEEELVKKAAINVMKKQREGKITESELKEEVKEYASVYKKRKKYIVKFNESQRCYQVDYNGNVLEYVEVDVETIPIMDNTKFKNAMNSYKSNILNVKVIDNINIPDGAENFDVSKNGDGTVKAWLIENSQDAEKYDLYIGGKDGVNMEHCGLTFSDFSSCVKMDLDYLYTDNASTMNLMFNRCSNIEELDLSNFNTKKVQNMREMFKYCYKLKKVDVSSFDTSEVNEMGMMFWQCKELTELDLSNFNTSKVTNMYFMFAECEKLRSLNISSFDTGKVNNMSQMFRSCKVLKSLDLSSFNTENVTDMSYMFNNCVILEKIYVGDNWNVTNVTNSVSMFWNCSDLVGEMVYDGTLPTDKTYATTTGGYLTYKSNPTK